MSQQRKHLHSIHVAHHKNTAQCETKRMPVPAEVCIPMSMHIGAPCKPLVAKGDTVKVGQLIGDTDAFVSAPIHSSVSGTVKSIETQRTLQVAMTRSSLSRPTENRKSAKISKFLRPTIFRSLLQP